MALFSGDTKTNATYGALIDVRSGSVGIGIIESDPSKKIPAFVYSKRFPVRSTPTTDPREQIVRLKQALVLAHAHLASDGRKALHDHAPGAQIEDIFAVCGAPWSTTIARAVSFEKEEAFEVTKKLVRTLSTEAEKFINERLQESDVADAFDLQATGRTMIGTQVNEYPVQDPLGLCGTSLRFVQVTSFAPKEIVAAVTELQEESFPDSHTIVHSYLSAAFCMMRTLYTHTNSYWLLDISGDAVEIGVVEDGVLMHTAFVSGGIESLLSAVGGTGDAPRHDTLSELNAFTQGALTPKQQERLTGKLQVYQKTITQTVADLSGTYFIPATIVLTAPGEVRDVFTKIMTDVFTTEGVQQIDLRVLNESDMQGAAHNAVDVHAAIAGHFYHVLQHSDAC